MSKNSLPALAVRGLSFFPNQDLKLDIGREESVNAFIDSLENNNDKIILLVQKDPLKDEINQDNIETIGCIAQIVYQVKLPNGNYRAKFNIISRIKVQEIEQLKPFIKVSYNVLNTFDGDDISKHINMLLKEVEMLGPSYLAEPDKVKRTLSKGVNSEELLDLIAYNILIEGSKYKYLAELDNSKRALMLLDDINLLKEYRKLDEKINNDVKKTIEESQKEYYLREKMRAIQSELGDKARQEQEIEDLRVKINSCGMPENIKKKALKELERYSSMTNMNAETGVIRNYLELVTDLPWTKSTTDVNDLRKVQEALDKNHYGLTKIKERIVEYIAVKMMTGKNPSTILCFAGPPGVGKTSLAMSIAEALGRKFVKQSVGGVRDESEIRGHRRTYLGALPGRIIKGMRDAGVVNPLYLIDEIDKMTSDYRGDPAAAMLEVLDPEQNTQFSDNYLEEPYDLSQVMFITTANSLADIPAPLRDRMEIIELSSYTEYEKYNIVVKHLITRELENHGLKENNLKISDDAIYAMIRNYTREAGVRELNRLIAKLCRKTVTEILNNKIECLEINEKNLEKYLGKARFFNNNGRDTGQVGIVTGLAYTAFGGDTLDIEVITYPGKGVIKLTGKLGDVMKESAEAALSYVKAHAHEFNITTDFNNTDVHIHVPEGAVPKDGPSAGVTLTTALVSAFSNKAVPSNIGMTGEVTLRGQVLPIGGLREKSIAAVRTGLKKIYIPFENERDLDEVPEEVKAVLEIKPVKHVNEILSEIFN